MKFKHTIIILAAGYCVDFLAALRKIMHAPDADTLFVIGTILKITGVVLLVYKLITHPKTRDFMNN